MFRINYDKNDRNDGKFKWDKIYKVMSEVINVINLLVSFKQSFQYPLLILLILILRVLESDQFSNQFSDKFVSRLTDKNFNRVDVVKSGSTVIYIVNRLQMEEKF